MEKFKDIVDRYGAFALWILMCLMMLAAIIGCIIGMSRSVAICCCGLFGSVISLLIFAWQAYGKWLDAKQMN